MEEYQKAKVGELLETNNTNLKHGDCSSIYISTTSNVIGTLNLYKDYEDVLSVGSTGAHGFEALLGGAKNVDLFDININQKAYYEYIKCAIMHLSYEDFVKYFSTTIVSDKLVYAHYKNVLSHNLYEKLVNHLDDDTNALFGPIYDAYDDNSFLFTSLFRYDYDLYIGHLKKLASFYKKDEFNKLKELLNDGASINYELCPITDLKDKFSKEYDLILFDNVLTYYQFFDKCNEKKDIINYLENDVTSLLKDNGQLQTTYLFLDGAFNFYMNRNNKKFADPFDELRRKMFLEDEVTIDLYKNYPGYRYNEIKGVEFNSPNPKNTVLTKTRKK
ncbi:MAG: hypothetical protein R3Y13_02050 [bacterium]